MNIEPDVRCRVLTTSTLESFAVGNTIVVSRGLIDVLPDEASLATLLAHDLAHIVLGHRIDTQYAFFDRMLFDEKDTFRHFGFRRTPEEEEAAAQKGAELLKNSPYKDQLGTPRLFIQALQERVKDIPNLISPHLGDPLPDNWAANASATASGDSTPVAAPAPANPQDKSIAALPLGGRVKMDPWNDELTMLKTKPVAIMSERDKMPFEVTPLFLTSPAAIKCAPWKLLRLWERSPVRMSEMSPIRASVRNRESRGQICAAYLPLGGVVQAAMKCTSSSRAELNVPCLITEYFPQNPQNKDFPQPYEIPLSIECLTLPSKLVYSPSCPAVPRDSGDDKFSRALSGLGSEASYEYRIIFSRASREAACPVLQADWPGGSTPGFYFGSRSSNVPPGAERSGRHPGPKLFDN